MSHPAQEMAHQAEAEAEAEAGTGTGETAAGAATRADAVPPIAMHQC